MVSRDKKGRYLVNNPPGPGRKSLYDEAMNDQAYKLALLGMDDKQIAGFFDISSDTYYRWKKEYPAFSDAIHRGKDIADAEIAHSLFKRARGMVVVSERAMKNKDGEVVVAQMKTELPPDTRAAARWLALRRRGKESADGVKWNEDDTLPPGGKDPGSLPDLGDDELDARIAELERRDREREGR